MAGTHFRMFLGAPTLADLKSDPAGYHWQTVTSGAHTADPAEWILPPATIEAATRRISLLYKNVIFEDNEDGGSCADELERSDAWNDVSHAVSSQSEASNLISWPPTDPRNADPLCEVSSESLSRANSISMSRVHSMYETQETQETESYAVSDGSSIVRFPTFHINLNSLVSLGTLATMAISMKGSQKINCLVAILEVDGPDAIVIKKGPDAGKEVSILKLVVGDETGGICKLTAWREVAEKWGGRSGDVGVRRGDIVSLENVLATTANLMARSLTASPNLKSRLDICYRTMPCTREDRRLRPDLRLGESDAVVRKVSCIVRWFQSLAGLT